MAGWEAVSAANSVKAFYSHQLTIGGEVTGNSMASGTLPIVAKLEYGSLPQVNNPPIPGVVVLSRRAGFSAKVALADVLGVGFDPDGDTYEVLIERQTDLGGTVIQGTRFISYQPPDGVSVPDVIRYRLVDGFGDTAEGQIEVAILPQPGTMTYNQVFLEILSGGIAHVVFAGALNQAYEIQVTDSLVPPIQWHGLPTAASAAQPGFYEATDAAGGGGSQRFYRTIVP